MTNSRFDLRWSAWVGLSFGAAIAAAEAPSQAMREGWRELLPSARVVLDPQNNICTNTRGPELDYYARKTDPRGNLIWVDSYGDPNRHESSKWLAVDSAGNIILTGHRSTQGMLTVKFGANGGVLWARLDPTVREGYRVEVDAADNVYVAGQVFDPYNRDDFVTIKYDPAGNQLWRRQRDFWGNQDGPHALAVTPAGRVAVTGGSSSNMATVVYDTNGNELFFDWRLASTGQDIAFGADDSVYFCGNAVGNAALVVALDPSGAQLWATQHLGPNGPFAFAYRLAIDSAGNIVAVGHCSSTTAYMDWLIFKLNPGGSVLWSRIYDGFGGNEEFCRSVAIGPDDSVYVAGSGGVSGVCGPISGLGDVVERYDPAGNLVWHYEEACASGVPRSIVIERFGDVVVSESTGDVIWLEQEDWMTLGAALPGSAGDPDLDVRGYLDPSGQITLSVENARPGTLGLHVLGWWRADTPLLGGTLIPYWNLTAPFQADGAGHASLVIPLPGFIPVATEMYLQSWLLDPAAVQGAAATDAVVKALQ